MPAKRGVATYDRNRVAVELAGLAWSSYDSFVFYHSVPSSLLAFERVAKRKDLQTQELAKGMGQR